MADTLKLIERLESDANFCRARVAVTIRTIGHDCAEAAQAIRDLVEGLESIRHHTDPDDPESYRSDDREGCLDAVQHIANALITKHQIEKSNNA